VQAVQDAPEGYGVEIEPPKRNGGQNALLHALLTDISQRRTWMGVQWDAEDWKRMLVSAWCRVRKESAIMVPALDGQGFDVIYRRTSRLSKAECAELIEYIQAWDATQAPQVALARLTKTSEDAGGYG
jgi:hypothetical protein